MNNDGVAQAMARGVVVAWCETFTLPKPFTLDFDKLTALIAAAFRASACPIEAACTAIIAERDRVLDALLCPVHGRCVPHALEEIGRLTAPTAPPATAAPAQTRAGGGT